MKNVLLGIDIGTSACKVAAFDLSGKVLAASTAEYEVYYPHPGWAEQDAEEWWKAVCQAIKELLQQGTVTADEIAGIGIDGQSWSAVPIDSDGKVLCNTPIWMDTRAVDICDRLNRELGDKLIFEHAGNSLQPSYTTAKILWYKEHMPQVYARIDKILQSNSFIAYRLTGICSQDVSQGYGLHCFEMRSGSWNKEMCEALGIPFSFLPDLYQCHQVIGGVTAAAAKETGLIAGTPVVAGGLDAACGTLGAGVIYAGETQEQGGQAGGMSICIDQYAADPRLILSFHVIPGKWLLQGGTTGGGGVMRWLEKEFGDYERTIAHTVGKSSMAQLDELAEVVSPGSDGLVFLPYMAGERSPIWDPKAKGVFYGLDFSKSKGHMIRAALEGVAYSLKHNLDIAEAIGAGVNELRAMGGAANSRLWTQIKADLTGKPIVVPSSDTATTLGAAILAGVGVGLYTDFEEAVRMTVKITRRHEPDMEKHKLYQKNYTTYLALYRNLQELMRMN
jgi:xylulokinase